MKKKNVYLIILFIFIVILSFFVFNAFFYTNLKFKQISKLDITLDDYLLDNNDNIVLSSIDEDYINIYKITTTNSSPTLFKQIAYDGNINQHELLAINNSYYYVYNTSNIIKININTKDVERYTKLSDDLLVIDDYDNELFTFNDNTLTSFVTSTSYHINNSIKNIKTIEFINNKIALLLTYDNDLYYYNFLDSTFTKFDNKTTDYRVYDNYLYYSYYKDNLLYFDVFNLTRSDKETFSINYINFSQMFVKNDYIYLVSQDYIYTVSISRKKQNETFKMGSYEASYSYSLDNVMIVNDKLMYIVMQKEELDSYTSSYYTNTYIYRYKK